MLRLGSSIDPGTGVHQAALEKRMFGATTFARAVVGKVAALGVLDVSPVTSANKWLQHDNSAALHSTRIRAQLMNE